MRKFLAVLAIIIGMSIAKFLDKDAAGDFLIELADNINKARKEKGL